MHITMDWYWQQFSILLEYKDQLDEYLQAVDDAWWYRSNKYKNKYNKIDKLAWQIAYLRDKMIYLKEKIESEYKDIIYTDYSKLLPDLD